MKSSNDLKSERADIISSLESIKDVATGDERDLTTDENTQVDGLLTELDNLSEKITRAEKVETSLRTAAAVSGVKVETEFSKGQEKDLEKFTFQAAMRAAYTGKSEGIIKEMDAEARNESRYTGQEYKGIGIPASILTRAWATSDVNSVETMSFTDELQANLVLASAGANTYFGINNMKFPVFSSIGSTWVGEDGTSGAASVSGATSNVTLTPKKLISVVNMTQESFVQNAGLEAALTRNMATEVASSLEFALLDDGDIANAPTSIFAGAATGPTTAFTAAAALSMESTLIANGVQRSGARMAYLLDPDAYAAAKAAVQVTGVSALWDNTDRRVNGYYAFVSSNVSNAAAGGKDCSLMGDFSKVHIATFGGLDILFDPYTNATTGLPRMVVTSLCDGAAIQNSTAFVQQTEA